MDWNEFQNWKWNKKVKAMQGPSPSRQGVLLVLCLAGLFLIVGSALVKIIY
ncbi:hypothetical protein AB8810_11155 [Xanthomonas sp. NCPPB 3005]|uniref:hypothetical protein n=1 Tax=Xanthomonas sp. NCPPB 3005 TaxID=3240913 RepID=UPI003511A07E